MNLKHLLRDIALLGVALAATAGLTGCKDDFDTPPVNVPWPPCNPTPP